MPKPVSPRPNPLLTQRLPSLGQLEEQKLLINLKKLPDNPLRARTQKKMPRLSQPCAAHKCIIHRSDHPRRSDRSSLDGDDWSDGIIVAANGCWRQPVGPPGAVGPKDEFLAFLTPRLRQELPDVIVQKLRVGGVGRSAGGMAPERRNRLQHHARDEGRFVARVGEREVEVGF